MKKVLLAAVMALLMVDVASAYRAPRASADVLKRNMDSSGGRWFAYFGHVAMYDPYAKPIKVNGRKTILPILEVTIAKPAIRQNTLRSMMSNHYQGARYGKAYGYKGRRVIRAGNYQRTHYVSRYTIVPWYSPGRRTYSWRFSWRRWFYKKWYNKTARFRCDSFVNYCYAKGTGHRLVNWQWTTTPSRIHKALPYRR